jgi:hypothetical protein
MTYSERLDNPDSLSVSKARKYTEVLARVCGLIGQRSDRPLGQVVSHLSRAWLR